MKHATEIAAAVRSGRVSAVAIAERHLAALRAEGDTLVAVTRILADRALAEAAAVDGAVAAGRDPGPLAGVPYGVKDLFDVAGLPTTAGSLLYADAPPARADAEAARRLRGAGAILMATLNMDEFAYGFATINARHGTTRNPHDPARLAGGSSGGSAAAVAAGLLPFSLGSDTNGSIRVPASLCGLYGLKPTHGALPMDGVFPFAQSFDDIGPFATSVDDLRVVWEALGGTGANASGVIRVARLGGRFRANADPEQIAAIDAIASDAPLIDLPDIARARAAAFLMTAAEGGAVHRPSFEAGHAMAFDPATRDRLLAGALLPPALYDQASAFGREFRAALTAIFVDHDVLLAPAAPCVAPPVSDPRILIDGEWTPARRDLGIHTQPISFAALPALAIPLRRPGRLPLGLQLIGRPGGEGTLFRFAAQLEDAGVAGVSEPAMLFQGEDA